MTRAPIDILNMIFGRSLLGVTGLVEEFMPQLVREVVRARRLFMPFGQVIELARTKVREFEPLLAEHLGDSLMAGWISGFSTVASLFPPWLEKEFATGIRSGEPPEPPSVRLFKMFPTDEPQVRLKIIENAAERLLERNILTRDEFDSVSEDAQREAFTIAGDLGTETIDRFRGFLADEIQQGASLEGFRNRVDEHFGTAPIAPGHLENVYRTNIQGALRDGRETLASNPIVYATFPYQQYIPVHDARARHDHTELGRLGLNGTGVYRRDDPMWDHFTPPWDYNCRCGVRLMTIEAAARAGVREAQDWLRTGEPPRFPEYRYAMIPFEPKPGFGSRGKVGVAV